MAYIGAPPQNRVLSSDDIAQGAVTLNDINFTDQPTNMDITGTIDKHTMRLADGVTITGDVTISDDLVLSKISDDGNAITMTNDGSSRTITGSGSIEASTLSQTPNQSLTGMTGTIGSAVTNNAGVASGTIGSVVTGSPALNLTNATGDLSNAIPYNSSSGSGSQNIGGLRFQWGKGTFGSSSSGGGTTTFGVANAYYIVTRIDYTGFSEAPHLIQAYCGNGYHETKIANFENQFGHASGDYFNFIVTSSRTAGFYGIDYRWMIIGKAS
jgi:hypothetical protein